MPLQASITEWCVSAEISEDLDAANNVFDRLVSEDYIVAAESSSSSKKSSKSGKSSSKKRLASKEDGSGLEGSNASSGSSASVAGPVYHWNMEKINKLDVLLPVEDLEAEKVENSRKSKRGKRQTLQTTESASVTTDGGNGDNYGTSEASTNIEDGNVQEAATAGKFEMAMLQPPVRNHRAASVLVDPLATVRARAPMIEIPDDQPEEDSASEAPEEHLDDTIDVLQKYLQSLAPELRKKLNSADYSILMSSLVRLCQDMLGWSDKMVFDVGNLKTKSLSQLNKSIDLNFNVLTNQINRMSSEKGIETKRTIVRCLREMKKILEAPLLQERIEMSPGEDIEWKVDGVINLDNDDEEEEEIGRLVFTNYRVLYFGPNAKTSEQHGTQPDISVPLGAILSISKLGDKKMSSKTKRLEIITKDHRVLRWGFKSGSHRRKEISAWLKNYIATMPKNLFCFQVYQALNNNNGANSISDSETSLSRSTSPAIASSSTHNGSSSVNSPSDDKKSKNRRINTADPSRPEFDGWDFYDPHTEFHRQGVSADPSWTYTNANVDYALCDTYPSAIWVPSAFNSDLLSAAASFRSRNRLPALAYYHRANGATITRCSQPAVGVSRKRSKEDESLLWEIGSANTNTNRLPIYDARPKANAVANTAMGYGYELVQHYANCSLTFCDIENIHVMRNSLAKLRDAIHKPESTKFQAEVDDSGWLTHQSLVINSALRIVDLIHDQNTSVLIHCSDGWDRTAQLVSLSCLMLDPFYRTLNGFATLVEKDWLSFGHRFSLRHAFDGSSSGDRAPIFHQFLETVWQFVRQHPKIFEFNETFLITLLDEVYNCYYGTFIHDCQKERLEAQLPTKTISVWTGLLSRSVRSKFINPLFTPTSEVVMMNSSTQCLAIWEQYYFRYLPRLNLPPSIDVLIAEAIARATTGQLSTVNSTHADSNGAASPKLTNSSDANPPSLLASSLPTHSTALSSSSNSVLRGSTGRSSPVDQDSGKKKPPFKRNRNTDPEK